MNALSCLKFDLEAKCIPTGCENLDMALGSGIRLGSITEFVGNSGAGKTQLSLQLVFNTILPSPVGLIDGDAVYISTRRNFCPQRVIHLADVSVSLWENSFSKNKNRSLDFRTNYTNEKALSRIHHKLVQRIPELISTVYQLDLLAIKHPNIRLVVIDSFSSLLRNLEPSERIRIVYELFHVLQNFATTNQSAVIITNDLTPHVTPNSMEPAMMKPALGDAYHHRLSQRILLNKEDEKQITVAQILKNLNGGPAQCKIKVVDDGVKDA
ncbi:CLUMA_CG005038, isoform A [Clunio marinus]|uniref:DNA repair protein RAD51 homolog 3 n=1 Tax=Clunio marinus TaxID=568069 RepID=A0A1J1HTN8_9DIPT|nr:CLUMA_CG005038, isoform A [Clunio marinus]